MAVNSNEYVFIVDDDEAIRDGLSDLLESAGLRAQQFPSAEEFLKSWNPECAGCLVLDVRLPGMSGMELQRHLAESGIVLPVIIMTAHGDMPMVRRALKAGAIEFLIKPFQDEELLRAVEQAFAANREKRKNDELLNSIETRLESLTPRERQVMELVTAGLQNKDIADRLALSIVTIKMHRGRLMKKMQAGSFADLVKMSEKIDRTMQSNGAEASE